MAGAGVAAEVAAMSARGLRIGVGAAVIGGAIAASAAQARQQEAINYCMQRYRSYDPQSMTYLASDGYRRHCP